MESKFADLSLSTEEDEELVLDPSDDCEVHETSEFCLVGRFLTDQTINFNAMRNRMANLWKPVMGVAVKSVGGGRFLFQFYHGLDMNRVLDGSPWTFGNYPLLLHHPQKGEHPLRVPLIKLPFWVHINDLPHGYLSEKVGNQLGNFIGKFLEYDKSNNLAAWRSYMRIRVEIDVTQPLKRFKKIRQANGGSFVVNFQYEKLHIFCFICGLLGHSENFCEVRFQSGDEIVKKEWGTFLRVSDLRDTAMATSKWIRDGSEKMPKTNSGGSSSMKGMPENQGDDWVNAHEDLVIQDLIRRPFRHDNYGQLRTMQSNPIFEENAVQKVTNFGEITVDEEKKRKRGKTVTDNNQLLVASQTKENDEAAVTGHFLSAGPVFGACRE